MKFTRRSKDYLKNKPFESEAFKRSVVWQKGMVIEMDKVLSAIGLARKAGKLVFGADAVIDEIRSKKARLTLIASDASESTIKRITDKSVFYGVKYEIIDYTRKELGSALGKPLCACAAVCDGNFAEMYRQAKLKTAEVN